MQIALEDLITRWKGRPASFEVALSNDLRAYQGILDGPYLGEDGGVGFMLGSRLIEGDVAVEGPIIDFSPPTDRGQPTVADSYVGLRAIALPLVVDVQDDAASWEATGDDERIARCRLVAL